MATVMAVIRAARLIFRNNLEKIAFVVHACFLASGRVLNATGRSADTVFLFPFTDEVGIDPWNELEYIYMFVYVNLEKGSRKELVKCLVMKDKLMVIALADGPSELVSLEIEIGDYAGANGGNYSDEFKNLDKLVQSINTEIIAKLYDSSNPARIPVLPINPGSGSDIFPGADAGMYSRRGGFGGDGSMPIGPNDPRWFGGDGEPRFPGANP